jgi:hypothetical protein
MKEKHKASPRRTITTKSTPQPQTPQTHKSKPENNTTENSIPV